MSYQFDGQNYVLVDRYGYHPQGQPTVLTPEEYRRYQNNLLENGLTGGQSRGSGRSTRQSRRTSQYVGPLHPTSQIGSASVPDEISSNPDAVDRDLILQQNLYRYLDNKREWQVFNRHLNALIRQDPNYNIHYHEDELLRKAAAVADDAKIIQVILENGANPDALDGDALLSAIQRNKSGIFETLINFGATVMPQHLTALVTPVNGGSRSDAITKIDMLRNFLNQFDPNQVLIPNTEARELFRNLLQQAINFNNVAAINVLREALQEPVSSADNEKAFAQAYASNDYATMLTVLNQPNHGGLDLNRFGGLLLEKAVRNGAADQIAAIIATGLPVSAFNEAALQLAISLNKANVVEALLAQGADKDNAAVKAALTNLNNAAMTDLVESWTPAECPVCSVECGRDVHTKTCENNHKICRTCYNQWRQTKQRGDPTRNVPCPSCRANYVLSPQQH